MTARHAAGLFLILRDVAFFGLGCWGLFDLTVWLIWRTNS